MQNEAFGSWKMWSLHGLLHIDWLIYFLGGEAMYILGETEILIVVSECVFLSKINNIDLLDQEWLILQCPATDFLSLTSRQQIHCKKNSAFLNKKEQETKVKLHFPYPQFSYYLCAF